MVISAPLEVPTLLFGSTLFTLTHGLSALSGAPAELQRLRRAEQFRSEYGFDRDELLWSLVPPAALYWYLAEGDTVYELAIKAKRGPLGMGDDPRSLAHILTRLLDTEEDSYATKAARLEGAIRRARTISAWMRTTPASSPPGALSMPPARRGNWSTILCRRYLLTGPRRRLLHRPQIKPPRSRPRRQRQRPALPRRRTLGLPRRSPLRIRLVATGARLARPRRKRGRGGEGTGGGRQRRRRWRRR